jgi:hypothetical protein
LAESRGIQAASRSENGNCVEVDREKLTKDSDEESEKSAKDSDEEYEHWGLWSISFGI